MKKPLFIAFEGIDGSGKSMQVQLLADSLEKAGHKVYSTFEPTDSRIGSILKDILKHKMEADPVGRSVRKIKNYRIVMFSLQLNISFEEAVSNSAKLTLIPPQSGA